MYLISVFVILGLQEVLVELVSLIVTTYNYDCYFYSCNLTIIINFHPLSLVVSCADDPCEPSETCFDIPGDFVCCPPGMNILAADNSTCLACELL